ncbi:WXG100 family type VII secretion target [Paenibacillus sp. 843]|uniref:WXG100 family type VII secretion target n=1 Tax=Paenibacillus sp. 843 TaxID=3341795 RepID=UPI00372BC118
MPRILVPPEVLIRVSEEAARSAEELETTKNRLDQQITYMMSSWEGTTRSRFFEDFQHAHGEMNKTIEHLRIIGQELKTIAFRFISADMHEDLMLAAAAASAANEPKTFWDHAGDFWQGLQTGAKTVANSVKDTATSLVEDPLDTAKDMAYNMTIGAVEEVVDTAVWGGKMIFDADTQEKFAADVEASGGAFNFAGQQAAMTIAGLVGRRFGVKTHPHLKHDSGGDGGTGQGGTEQSPVPTKPGGGSNPNDFVNPHSEKHMFDPSKPSTPNRTQYGQDVDVEGLRQETMTNPDKAYSNWPNPNNPNSQRITKYYKEFDGNISTPDTVTGSHRVFENLDDPTRSSHFPYFPRK